MNKKQGFTLIELLAVIVILAVIALIATPIIMNVINDSKRGAAKDSGYAIIKAGELATAKMEFEFPGIYDETSELNYKGTRPTKMNLQIESNGTTTFTGFIDGYCVVKKSDTSEVTIDDTKKTAETCVVAPIIKGNIEVDLKDGLIPVTFDENGNTVKADVNNWFDYDNKQWANAVSVTSATRSTYQTASASTPIKETDILGYFVYIPRYRYQLWNAENGVIGPQEIKIEFEKKSTNKSNGTKNGEWITHPAFTFGTDELNGIWVGKFELTGTSDVPTIKPNQIILNNLNVSSFFHTIKSMKNDSYGLSSYDSHMMKNIEWGAVVYLSHSKYGKNSEIWINNTFTGLSSITGCSGDSVSAFMAEGVTACETGRKYSETGGFNASTTGNITGVYDMSGGLTEYMMGVLLDSTGNPIYGNSGFNASTMPETKYYDAYEKTTGDHDFAKAKLGDATREIILKTNNNVGGWYGDFSVMLVEAEPWLSRGGNAGLNAYSGAFFFYQDTGNLAEHLGSRAVLTRD